MPRLVYFCYFIINLYSFFFVPQKDLTHRAIVDCTTLLTELRKRFGFVRRYKAINHPNVGNYSTFSAMTSNFAEAKRKFNDLLENHKLFNCVNDDIVAINTEYFQSDDYRKIIELWRNFYMTMFPVASQFELPSGKVNRYQYVDQYRSAEKRFVCVFMLIAGFFSLMAIALYFNYQWWKRATQKRQFSKQIDLVRFTV